MLTGTVLLSIANKLHESQLLPGHKRAPRKREKFQYILILIQFQRLELKIILVLSAQQLVLAAPLTLARAQR